MEQKKKKKKKKKQNLYVGQEAAVKTRYGTTHSLRSKLRKLVFTYFFPAWMTCPLL